MSTILEDLRVSLGIPVDNLSFDTELLIGINAAKSTLVQLGVTELDITIDDTTTWPVFNVDVVGELSKQYLLINLRTIFDPIASETIQSTMDRRLKELESRIRHEIEEDADV